MLVRPERRPRGERSCKPRGHGRSPRPCFRSSWFVSTVPSPAPASCSPEIAARGTLGEKASWRIPGKTILWASAVALVVIAVGAYLAMRDLDWEDHAQIIAHRGGAGVAPENTMAAFKRGIADGADWLELDVQENADGVVVIGHDRDFMRVAGANLEVWQATDADLADLDVGSFFGPAVLGSAGADAA